MSTLFAGIQAGWYPDPTYADRERYFDGRRWTAQVRGEGVMPPHAGAGWYPDPASPYNLRYYNGVEFTTRVMPKPGARPPWMRWGRRATIAAK